jgi:hypothetical protein
MTTETQERTPPVPDDDGTVVAESAPPPSEPAGDADSWSDVTAVAVPQSSRMEVVVATRNSWSCPD